MTKLSPTLAKAHGLGALDSDLISDPTGRHLVIALVDCSKLMTDTDSGVTEPTVRVLLIEAVTPEDRRGAAASLRRSAEERHGGTTLPFDPDTGEILEVDA